ncbi:hypothetical protein CCYN2B_220032 [Capnocytophaga cynodegmi]|uniref:Uncharacterized protein n=1 Tax=Capnocytophaga cynodegmi TaxID=28189 RepID=A0A0B7H9N9_9FLAO|nr:hypothetical protein CCYN2B_220032 [Capnocytophaga cynodegmi]
MHFKVHIILSFKFIEGFNIIFLYDFNLKIDFKTLFYIELDIKIL